jgi:endonuclease VIII-like 1
MPELAEVKIMSEYINSVSEGKLYLNAKKSPETKVKTEMENPFDGLPFTIEAQSRGKELMLTLTSIGGEERSLKFAMGMSGNWATSTPGELVKHAHLRFNREDGVNLLMVDVRRFAKWDWTESWSDKRGPCPLTEYEAFVKNIRSSSSKKIFEKPIYDIMMDQKYFNGIGNYLRAEILHRANVNPFLPASEIITYHLFELCHDVCQESYLVGGGELKDWDNPFKRGYGRGRINEKMGKLADTSFRDWLQCYGKSGHSIEDSKGRRFWFDKKWLNE